MWPMAGTGSSVTASSSLPSASGSEKHATSPASARTPPAQLKPRSCVTCRRRKVKCDKLVPRCSTCTRAQIACVYPSPDRPPRWARSLAASNTQAPQFMDRVRNLESLVTELRAQLEQANATHRSAGDELAVPNSPRASTLERGAEQQRDRLLPTNTENAEKHFGRLVFQDTSRSRYISSAFWSRVSDEIDGLKKDARGLANDESDSSVEEASPGKSPSTMELERTPSERHAFLFRHNLGPSVHELGEFQPLPSQIPFLLDVFAENVNLMSQIVHIPTVNRLVRGSRGSNMHFTPANEALMFSIYYAAITSMDEDDVMTNFGSSRTDLNLKYRLGLEHALAKADFLNQPDIVLVQALVIFVSLARRHESPRWVYMLTGIAIRMAQYVGLQRDGTNFQHLTPFQTEMRRRVWWALCTLDQRASEDQGTDLTITSGSFDTKIPLNINDADINPETRVMPVERDGVTDMTFARMTVGLTDIQRQIMAPGFGDGPAGLEDQSRLLNQIYQKYEHGYFQKTTKAENIAHLVGVTIVRLVLAKMTLVVFLPVLFSTPSEHFSDEIRAKLLVSAIEVAEYNHALNSEPACRQWRWIYQTYTHWHAIVYLLIEVARRGLVAYC